MYLKILFVFLAGFFLIKGIMAMAVVPAAGTISAYHQRLADAGK